MTGGAIAAAIEPNALIETPLRLTVGATVRNGGVEPLTTCERALADALPPEEPRALGSQVSTEAGAIQDAMLRYAHRSVSDTNESQQEIVEFGGQTQRR